MASWLVCSSLDRAFRVRALAGDIVLYQETMIIVSWLYLTGTGIKKRLSRVLHCDKVHDGSLRTGGK